MDATYGLFDGEDLVGTASRQANILKCLAIRHSYAGGAAFHQLISFLLTEIYQAGYEEVLVFTKASKRESFEHLGFKLLVETEDVAFMERSQAGLAAYLADLKAQAPFSEGQRLGAVVMNANPFTKGHRYLIEEALKAVDGLYVFVLSEDQSLFDKATRLNLVRQGTADLDQVYVVETKHYMVSQATFPAYFLKADQSAVKAQAAVDARLFKEKIAPSLGISQRFVGEEPLSPTTDSYNQVMAEIFAPELKLQIIPRRHLDQAGDVISASKVRALLLDGKLEAAQAYLPPASRAFVASQAGQTMLAERKDLSQSHDY